MSLFIIFIVNSCGGSSGTSNDSKNEEDNRYYILEPQTSTINGPLGKAYTVIQRRYKAKKYDISPKIFVEIELSDASKLPDGFSPQDIGTRENRGDSKYPMLANFIIEFLDEEGDIVEIKDESYNVGPALRMAQGERNTVEFYLPYNKEKDVKFFRIKSDFYSNEIKSENMENSSDAIEDEEFDRAMKHAKKAVETTTKMMKDIQDMVK